MSGDSAPNSQAPPSESVVVPRPTVAQSGDYYGRAVNLASRITGVARPASVLVDEPTKERVGDRFHYSFAGERRLKGIDHKVKLFRARREPGKRPSEPRDPR